MRRAAPSAAGFRGGPLTRTAVNKAERAAKDGHPGLHSASTGDVGAQTAPHKHESGGHYLPDSALLTEKHPLGNLRWVERPAKAWAESSRKQRNTPPFLSLEGLGSESRGRVKDARDAHQPSASLLGRARDLGPCNILGVTDSSGRRAPLRGSKHWCSDGA